MTIECLSMAQPYLNILLLNFSTPWRPYLIIISMLYASGHISNLLRLIYYCPQGIKILLRIQLIINEKQCR